MATMPFSNFVSTHRIGAADITVISEGTISWPPRFPVPEDEWRAAMPDADDRGFVPLGTNAVHIKIGNASILIDPGYDVPESDWSKWLAEYLAPVTRTPGMLPALQQIGVRPEEISHVLITHGDFDHIAGLTVMRDGQLEPRYPNARHYIGRADWEANPERSDPNSHLSLNLGAVERAGLLELLDQETEIVPGVTMIPTPGESPGHHVVRVESGGEIFVALGDLFHHTTEIEHKDWTPANRDVPAMLASRQRIMPDCASNGAICVFAHEPFPGWGRIEQSGEQYRWQPIWRG
jgi:glyoxylase-like metal-dependent hydrolase (beta-lactamase superfamily II)